MISFKPGLHALQRRLGADPDFERAASERWIVAPASRSYVHKAHFLDGQLDKIRDVEFTTLPDLRRNFLGDFDTLEGETIGLRFRHVDLVDGVLYAGRASRHLRPRRQRLPFYREPEEQMDGAMYESWNGNRWFGTWLMDDCLAYPLAAACAKTVTTVPAPTSGHVPRYEELLGIKPLRRTALHFENLVLMQDGANNENRRERAAHLRERLVAATAPGGLAPHPGVFLLRGTTGDRRVLQNEQALAEQLACTRGFRVLEPVKNSVDEIVAACASARVVIGVEGSHLVHGLMTLAPNAALCVIMPPYRVCSILKLATDRQGQRFAFIVGEGGRDEFSVDADDVERTLDLALRQTPAGLKPLQTAS